MSTYKNAEKHEEKSNKIYYNFVTLRELRGRKKAGKRDFLFEEGESIMGYHPKGHKMLICKFQILFPVVFR